MSEHTHLTGVILAGGKSERFGGVEALPKPAVLINGIPLVVHAATQLIRAGCRRIIVLTGANHVQLQAALALPSAAGRLTVGPDQSAKITLRFSGNDTATGGRLAQLSRAELADGALISYTDVFADCDLTQLLDLRRDTHASLAMLAVNPRQPWGALELQGTRVVDFAEKPIRQDEWINGGIFAADATLLDAIETPQDALEGPVMARLIARQSVQALRHTGWWRAVDTTKDRRIAQTDDFARFDYAPDMRPQLTPR
ncbi:sugar phosphate nucleotidyltransferase [Yoonia sp. I 8.24]|uniref:nucleotidyltransferase family protein n=1 Tax=Yoonia sp. I 8.24 TaxID=1537229 RepID=UPI001EE1455D|nr:sugar phosphate nucleotidyltransferase [Yoonia sp. I 8.24]MCG3267177.1 NTP transferase domain-containing protein [Yoonia sp. I 8.24]